ncbi:MAG: cytochrome d ubiquinol oxidase subunit II [Actinomycetota bacterium]
MSDVLTLQNVVAAVLFGGILLYAVFGGADYGGGFWDLFAGGAERGRRPRALIDRAIGPVWEANHVWLIFVLVVTWTAFSIAFFAIMTTLFVPLALAGLGIVLRGSGFAFRRVVVRTPEQRATGAAFALSSVITPFFFGTIAGGIASGRVPAAGDGDAMTSWVNPTSILGGALAVFVCAYVAAMFLIAEARMRHVDDLEAYFRRRAFVAAFVTGALAIAGIFVLRSDAHRLYTRLIGPGLPFVVLSVVCGLAALVLVRRASPQILRALAVAAVGAVIVGWGIAQYPEMLGTHLTIAAAASPRPTLVATVVVSVVAAILCVPSLALLYVLQQRGRLEEV